MIRLALILFALLPAPAIGADEMVSRALRDAIAAFDRAAPHLGREALDVDIAAYGDALRQRRFHSSYWGGAISVEIVSGQTSDAGCNSFAAYVSLPPRDGRIILAICPVFSTPGTEALRRLTMLHEMVHVVAGPDECRAMAFAARVEQLAFGNYTPVERYWRANNCARSGFSLP